MSDPTGELVQQAHRTYVLSLKAMDAELDALRDFANEFKGEESMRNLIAAQKCIQDELINQGQQ